MGLSKSRLNRPERTNFFQVIQCFFMTHWVFCCSVTQSCPTLCDHWTVASQASLSLTISWSLLRLMSIESMMPSNHLILCHPLLLSSIFLSIRVFSSESTLHIMWPKYWSFRFSISPSNEELVDFP